MDIIDLKRDKTGAKNQVKRNIENGSGYWLDGQCDECIRKGISEAVDLNFRLMEAVPDVFMRPGRIMTGPVSVINGYNVTALSRAYAYEYPIEFAIEAKTTMGEYEFKNLVIKNLAQEVRRVAANQELEDFVICPYIPVEMIRAIDANTFQPKIGFKTRYGLLKK